MEKKTSVPQSILRHIAEEDIPAREINLWPKVLAYLEFNRRVTSATGLRANGPTAAPRRRFGLIGSVALALLLVMVALLATPQGRVLTQNALRFFTFQEVDHILPVPTDTLTPAIPQATPTLTVMATAEPTADPTIAAQATRLAQPSATPEPTPLSYDTIAGVEKAAGFKVVEPAKLPVGYRLTEAYYSPESQLVCLEYYLSSADTNNYVSILESASAPLPSISELFTNHGIYTSTRLVDIGGAQDGQGLYASGDMLPSKVCGNFGQDQMLQVQTGGLSFIIFARMETGTSQHHNFMTLMQMSRLAESISGVYTIPDDQIDPDFITSQAEAERLAGFRIKLPTQLPEGIALDHFKVEKAGGVVTLSATYLFYGGAWEGFVLRIISGSMDTLESLNRPTDPQNPEYLKIRLRGTDGIISQGLYDAGVWLRLDTIHDGGADLVWFEDGLEYRIGGFNRYSQAGWLAIAEGLK